MSSVVVGLPQPRAWHGVEMVNDKVFIFGGGRNPGVPTDDVLVYSLSENRCCALNNLTLPSAGNGDDSNMGHLDVVGWCR